MSDKTSQILQDALALPVLERAVLVDGLLSSLDRPDTRIDELWAREAEDRLAAYRNGEMEAIPAEEVFAELEQP
jgi:putative addiction module component (TIGR02574 family)